MALYQKQTNKQTYVSQMPLDVGYLRSFYERSGHRLLLLDYDGTLMPHIPLAQLAQPSTALVDALDTVCRDPCNTVYVITGRKKEDLEDWFGHIPGRYLSHTSMRAQYRIATLCLQHGS
mmetsp:Transcript_38022/g.103755  ORF Transcript_38022/g.103755 Transcript_38022/m.103755 type:complete len:119 (+) Transcript_38022:141-497(+)